MKSVSSFSSIDILWLAAVHSVPLRLAKCHKNVHPRLLL